LFPHSTAFDYGDLEYYLKQVGTKFNVYTFRTATLIFRLFRAYETTNQIRVQSGFGIAFAI